MNANDKKQRNIRIGAGAGFARDRIEPAVELAKFGNLDYLVFECLAERTIALAQEEKAKDPSRGYDPQLGERMRAILPLAEKNGFRIVTNMGAANPMEAGRLTADIARSLGVQGLKIAVVQGDDVLDLVKDKNFAFLETGDSITLYGEQLVSANAYLGAKSICDALSLGANVIICGRVSDAALFLGPLAHEFAWAFDDWDRLAAGTLVGHLLECAGQISGGYFADPGRKDVPDLARLGFPIGEVSPNGQVVITKLEGSGGVVSEATCKEQLLYEIHNPKNYIQPDVIVDFTAVTVTEQSKNRVLLSGAKGRERPEKLKVSVAYKDGFIGEGQISYAGSGAAKRARLAKDVVKQRLLDSEMKLSEMKLDLIGIDALHSSRLSAESADPYEVRLRVIARTECREDAEIVGREVEALYTNGPAGGGGATHSVKQIIAIQSVMLPRSEVNSTVFVMEA